MAQANALLSPDFGEERVHELVPGGEGMALTKTNRKLFVRRYLHWILVESVEKQFKAFRWVWSRDDGMPTKFLLWVT